MTRGLVTLAALTLFLPFAVQAQPEPAHRENRGPSRMQERIFQRLGLSDAQKEQVMKLRLENQKEQTELMAKIRIARLDLREMLLADKPDRSALEKKITAISDLQNQEKLNMLHHLFAVYDLLTPEQQKKWKDHMQGMGTGFDGGRRGRGVHRMGMLTDPPAPGDQPEPEGEAPPPSDEPEAH